MDAAEPQPGPPPAEVEHAPRPVGPQPSGSAPAPDVAAGHGTEHLHPVGTGGEPGGVAAPVEGGAAGEAGGQPAGVTEPVEAGVAVGEVEPVEAGAAAEEVELVELALASVELSQEGLLPATGTVTLLAMEGTGQLDIVMARADALLVQEAMAGTPPPRPRTHDLLLAAVDALHGAITGVTLVERRSGGLYVANLRVRRPDGSVIELDARPSDALNVALRSTGAVLRAARSLVDVPAN